MPVSVVLKDIYYTVKGFPLLRNINLNVNQGDIILINGRSGHGKSSILELCAGLIKPDNGDVLWDNVSLSLMSKSQMQQLRFKMGFAFQLHALISNYSIYENIALPIRCRTEYNDKEIGNRVRFVMEQFGLYGVDKLFPESLSTGQLKLASLARAFAGNPSLVMLDEPLSGTDHRTSRGIVNVLTEYIREKNITMIVITQDFTIFKEFTTVKYILESGKLVEWTRDDNPHDTDFNDEQNEFTDEIVG